MNSLIKYQTLIEPGYLIISREPVIIYAVLGNAVVVTMHDKRYHFGGAIHFLYPRIEERENATVKYGNVSILAMYNAMIKLGSSKSDIIARIFGGSDKAGELIGRANIKQSKKTLRLLGVKIAEIDAGGKMGRKIVYSNKTDEAAVRNVNSLREHDWYPYQ